MPYTSIELSWLIYVKMMEQSPHPMMGEKRGIGNTSQSEGNSPMQTLGLKSSIDV
jgi:hypothetical protein